MQWEKSHNRKFVPCQHLFFLWYLQHLLGVWGTASHPACWWHSLLIPESRAPSAATRLTQLIPHHKRPGCLCPAAAHGHPSQSWCQMWMQWVLLPTGLQPSALDLVRSCHTGGCQGKVGRSVQCPHQFHGLSLSKGVSAHLQAQFYVTVFFV